MRRSGAGLRAIAGASSVAAPRGPGAGLQSYICGSQSPTDHDACSGLVVAGPGRHPAGRQPPCAPGVLASPMSDDRTTLILPVENQVRELDAKLLLACVAAERGFPVVMGSRALVHHRVSSIPARRLPREEPAPTQRDDVRHPRQAGSRHRRLGRGGAGPSSGRRTSTTGAGCLPRRCGSARRSSPGDPRTRRSSGVTRATTEPRSTSRGTPAPT